MNNYQKSVLPKLRFLQFKDSPAWLIKNLGQISVPVKDRAGTKKYVLMSVTSGVGLIPQIEKFGREIAGNAYSDYYVIKKNDFAYNRSATKQFPEGFISMLIDYEEAALPNSIFTCFRIVDVRCVPEFFNHLFRNNYHGTWLRKYIEVGARAHGSLSVDTKHLWDMPVVCPRIEEQQKIADCLSSLDDLISVEDKKVEALKAHKKGLMQKLFPVEGKTFPEWRFPGYQDRWNEKRIGQLLSIGNGRDYKHLSNGNIPVYGSGGYMSSVDGFLYDGESVCIGRKGTINNPTFLEGKFWTVDTLFYTHSFVNCVPRFVYCIFENIDWLKYNEASGVPSLSKTTIEGIKIFIPKNMTEQQKIADCFFSIDALIIEQEKKIDALKIHKKGLMQGLFSSIQEICE